MVNALKSPYIGDGERVKCEGTIHDVVGDDANRNFLAVIWDRDGAEQGELEVPFADILETETPNIKPGMIVFVELVMSKTVEARTVHGVSNLIIAEWVDVQMPDGSPGIGLKPSKSEFYTPDSQTT